MQEAAKLFTGTAEEPRFLLANVDNCLSVGEVDKALNLLKGIKSHQSYLLINLAALFLPRVKWLIFI